VEHFVASCAPLRTRAAIFVVLAGCVARNAHAQIRASERAGVSQIVDGTLIEVAYGRPRLRGRTAFGGVVEWGEMWTPGANWATTFSVGKPVRLNGHIVPAGRYSVWVTPTETEWTFYLNRRARRYHLERPKPAEMFLGVPVTPATAPPVDLLTFDFPATRRNGATLRLQWGATVVSLDIEVDATAPHRPRLTARQVAPYEGTYAGWYYPEPTDSTPIRFRFWYEDGRLAGSGGSERYVLIPTGKPRQFWLESYDALGPVDVELEGPITFTIGRNGRATGFLMPAIEQPLWVRAVRADP
jgi:hypothetical protein